MDRYYVITGGPGAGKTMLIEALRARGFACAGESARLILQNQQRIDGPAQHERDAALYAEIILARDMENHAVMEAASGPVFFDRGVPELVGYFAMMGLPVPAHFTRATEIFRYNTQVFLAPFWPGIYAHDSERKHSLAEARRSAEAAARIYPALGYRLTELPMASVEERVAFVLSAIGLAGMARGE